jgi:hypothetical protein
MDFMMLVLRISAGLTVIYGLKLGVSYYFSGSDKGGKSHVPTKLRNY